MGRTHEKTRDVKGSRGRTLGNRGRGGCVLGESSFLKITRESFQLTSRPQLSTLSATKLMGHKALSPQRTFRSSCQEGSPLRL